MTRRVAVRVKGRKGDYWVYTLESWLRELRWLIESEYNVVAEIKVEESNTELPQVYVNDILVLEGVPGEEGYLYEALKKALDVILGRDANHS